LFEQGALRPQTPVLDGEPAKGLQFVADVKVLRFSQVGNVVVHQVEPRNENTFPPHSLHAPDQVPLILFAQLVQTQRLHCFYCEHVPPEIVSSRHFGFFSFLSLRCDENLFKSRVQPLHPPLVFIALQLFLSSLAIDAPLREGGKAVNLDFGETFLAHWDVASFELSENSVAFELSEGN